MQKVITVPLSRYPVDNGLRYQLYLKKREALSKNLNTQFPITLYI